MTIRQLLILGVLGIAGLLLGILFLTHPVQFHQIETLVEQAGIWGRVVFLLAYAGATLLILPATAFNLAGGAIYGWWEGLILTSAGGCLSAILAFELSRRLGQELVQRYLSQSWHELGEQLQSGGIPYTFAARLFPVIPYGVVSFVGGLSSIRRQDYWLGTLLGTPFGVAPFVLLGSSGVQVVTAHQVIPLMGAIALLALAIGGGTWFQQRYMSTPEP
ncbi:hypothetical protein BST81_07645 [Leptolyngbya sp. 'hensonii']|uniref:TVP38/TMEM64 family protein n=1 Tax=Leptolyngbya sp. 'hensonii' TaxID=1922337 RepID=UPI00094FDC19|nr:TVP38/TMEM64 family protein [Leptolyngbya sp. 'hensonii']OLP19076.1 hypothetical protein BST81_07645 [Leptolyngbya sp. 'hensonii']